MRPSHLNIFAPWYATSIRLTNMPVMVFWMFFIVPGHQAVSSDWFYTVRFDSFVWSSWTALSSPGGNYVFFSPPSFLVFYGYLASTCFQPYVLTWKPLLCAGKEHTCSISEGREKCRHVALPSAGKLMACNGLLRAGKSVEIVNIASG